MVATFLVIATPVVLAITTLAPLESAPRGGRTTIVEELAPDNGASVVNGEPTSDPQAGGRRNRRNRDRGQQETPGSDVATPVP
jgi:hypothetical protein